MKQRLWYICVSVFALLLFVGVLPGATAKADTNVCRIGTTSYSSLQEAVTAIQNSTKEGTIQLTADVEISNNIIIDGLHITLDLAGHTINGTDANGMYMFFVDQKAEFHLMDSKGNGKIQATDYMVIILVQDATFAMDGGTIINKETNVSETFGIYCMPGTLNVHKGCIEATVPFVAGEKMGDEVYHSLTITGGVFKGYYGCMIGPEMNVKISGGTFQSSNQTIESRDDGFEHMNSGLCIIYEDPQQPKVSITGGTFSGFLAGISWVDYNYDTANTEAKINPEDVSKASIPKNCGIYTVGSQAVETKYTKTVQSIRTEKML